MGMLRLWLAVLVMVEHLGLPFMHGIMSATVSVDCFFVMSGFIMVIVYRDGYERFGPRTFFKNRAIRIFPTYIAALILMMLATTYATNSLPGATTLAEFYAGSISLFDVIAVFFANIFIVGQDIIIITDQTHFTLHNLIYIKQAWSIAVELYCYLLIPFMARRLWLSILIFLASYILRAVMYQHGFSGGQWYDKFVLFDVGLFALGAISAHLYLLRRPVFKAATGFAALGLFIAVSLIWQELYDAFPRWSPHYIFVPPAIVLMAVLTALVTPILFGALRDSRVDRYLGEYSYPLYLVHTLAFPLGLVGTVWSPLVAITTTAAIVHTIEMFSEKWRRKNAPILNANVAAEAPARRQVNSPYVAASTVPAELPGR